jgi:hypothetical protein
MSYCGAEPTLFSLVVPRRANAFGSFLEKNKTHLLSRESYVFFVLNNLNTLWLLFWNRKSGWSMWLMFLVVLAIKEG